MPKSCKEAALALLACMQQQPCMKEQGGTLKECLKSDDREACTMQRNAYFECKRSQLDMRTRIRGTRVY